MTTRYAHAGTAAHHHLDWTAGSALSGVCSVISGSEALAWRYTSEMRGRVTDNVCAGGAPLDAFHA